MRQLLTFSILLLLLTACSQNDITNPDDWPQYKYDNYRSGVCNVKLDLNSLDLAWKYTADHNPVPAWYGPAYEDAYANSGPLPSMRDYDLAYYPIIVGDKLYYGSTSDDAVHCLDNQTGQELWRYTTNGPIHIAPVYDSGKLYFGSDDGYVYSINAKNGHLNWKYSPSDASQVKVLNNGRLISYWPIRTGVLLEDQKVYFGASLLPWKKSYFCAIDQKTGTVSGDGCYVREMNDLTIEGSMASTGEKLIQPQGRIAPAFFDKGTGQRQGSLPGSGGCFVLVTKDKHIIHPQTSRKKSLHELSSDDQPDFMTFNGGKEIVVKGDTSFVLTDNSLSAYERSTKKLIWLRRDFQAHRIILSGDYLFAGACDMVYGISTQNGLSLWEAQVQGTVFALAAARGGLYVSTGEGHIYCFKEGGAKNHLFAQNFHKKPAIEEHNESPVTTEHLKPLKLYIGPFVEPISRQSVSIRFQTLEKIDCTLSWSLDNLEVETQKSIAATNHQFTLPVRKDFRYTGVITTSDNRSLSFEYDNFFNFESIEQTLPTAESISANEEVLISELLSSSKLGAGVCFILGTSNSSISNAILKLSDHPIIQIDKSKSGISKLRKKLIKNKIYGPDWAAYTTSDISLNQIRSNLASAIWLESAKLFNPDQLIELLAPMGKAIICGMEIDSDWFSKAKLAWQVEFEEVNNTLVLTKKTIEDQGEWTHQYGRPDNSAFGGESLWGSTTTEEFDVQWMGRPGPRFQTDRSGRKPSPLSISGKLFVQGNERVIALDVYNGAIYWVKHFPGFIRMNIHRDCANWAADETHLFMSINDKILKVNQEDGQIEKVISVADHMGLEPGFVSVVNEFIIGSTSPSGSHYTDYHGGAGWYDWAEGPMAEKVISTSLFKKSKVSGDDIWRYTPKGLIINATITIADNKVYFVESRTSESKLSEKKRGKDEIFSKIYLLAIDIDSGQTIFEKSLDHHPGKTAYSMAAGSGKLVVLSSGDGNYYLYTHSAHDGELIWREELAWFNGNHGGHLSRPAIVGNKLIVKPAIYDLNTGNQLDYNVPKSGHGCASYALTEQSILYRGGSVTQFNFDTREFSRWERLRPDCWISTIPAQGMILSPEAGGGCSCGNWLETSMVMAPLSRAPITIARAGKDHLKDFKEETYGTYNLQYLPNEFTNQAKVEIKMKPGVNMEVYYTSDGSVPTTKSERYSNPFLISNSTQVRTLVIVDTEQDKQLYYRNKTFTKVNLDN